MYVLIYTSDQNNVWQQITKMCFKPESVQQHSKCSRVLLLNVGFVIYCKTCVSSVIIIFVYVRNFVLFQVCGMKLLSTVI